MGATGLEGIAGAVTVVTGFEKGSGKTTFLNHALASARPSGPVAAFTIGVDGALKGGRDGAPAPEIRVEPGDVVMTTDALARVSDARMEVLDCLPGRTTLGRLLVGRVVRAGSVTLVGSEHFSQLAGLIERTRQEGWAGTVLVDGAASRITQVSALGDVRFVFTVRVDPVNLARVATRVRTLAEISALPCLPAPSTGHRLEGPVTPEDLRGLPERAEVSVEDFTKFFLEPPELLRALGRYRFSVRRAFDLLCCVVTLRDLGREEFLAAAGPAAGARILFNPYEVQP